MVWQLTLSCAGVCLVLERVKWHPHFSGQDPGFPSSEMINVQLQQLTSACRDRWRALSHGAKTITWISISAQSRRLWWTTMLKIWMLHQRSFKFSDVHALKTCSTWRHIRSTPISTVSRRTQRIGVTKCKTWSKSPLLLWVIANGQKSVSQEYYIVDLWPFLLMENYEIMTFYIIVRYLREILL